MATVAIQEDRSFSIGRVFSRAFSVMGNYPLSVFGVSFLLGAVPPFVVSYALTGFRLDFQQQNEVIGLIGLGGLAVVVTLIFQAMIQGVIVHIALTDREGRRPTISESLGYALPRAMPLIAVSFLLVIGLAIGFVLFTFPFLFLATRWAVAPGAVVAERTGIFAAFGRSAELTAGARWKVLGLGLLLVVAIWLIALLGGVINVVVVGIGGIAPADMALNPILLLVGGISNTATIAFWSAIQASLYVELRDWKDGPSTDRLAEIFR